MRSLHSYRSLVLLAAFALAGCSSRTAAPLPPGPAPVSYRVIESNSGAVTDFGKLVDQTVAAEIVFFGELHDDPGTHRLQLALLEAAAARHGNVVLALEMFERDVQPVMDAYLAGEITEQEFLEKSRPWPNYPTDYRPLIEFARERGIPVLAANVPRRIAAQVSRGGLDTLRALPEAERHFVARELHCPKDAYYDRFAATMQGHPGMTDEVVFRFYEAQCIKDETMAESVVELLIARPDVLVIHMNGSFHSDYGSGVPERVLRRRPGSRVLTLTGIPVEDPATAVPGDERARADYLLFTKRPPAPSRE